MKILEKIKNIFEKIVDFLEYGMDGVPKTNLKIKYYNKEKFNNFYYYVIKINSNVRIVKYYNNFSKRKFIEICNRRRGVFKCFDIVYDKLQKEEWKALIKLLKKEGLYEDFDNYIIEKNKKRGKWEEKII